MKAPGVADAARRRTTPEALEERRLLLKTRFNAGSVAPPGGGGRTAPIAAGDESEKDAHPRLGTMHPFSITDPPTPEKERETIKARDVARVASKGKITVEEARGAPGRAHVGKLPRAGPKGARAETEARAPSQAARAMGESAREAPPTPAPTRVKRPAQAPCPEEEGECLDEAEAGECSGTTGTPAGISAAELLDTPEDNSGAR